jgi:FMN reductase
MTVDVPGGLNAQATDVVRIVTVSAGVSEPSTTRLLADRITQKAMDVIRDAGVPTSANVIELGPLAVDIARAIVTGFPSDRLQSAMRSLASADAVVVSTPVYKAGVSGLFKSFADVLDNDLLIAKPVILAATAGTPRHAMVVDEQLRPLFAFLRALAVPTSLFAGPEDWSSPALSERIERAAHEMSALVVSGAARSIADDAWTAYQHEFAGNATRSPRDAADVDFDTDLMRLATGRPGSPASRIDPLAASQPAGSDADARTRTPTGVADAAG